MTLNAHYTLSQSLISTHQPATIDVLMSFQSSENSDRPPRRPLNLSLVLDRSGSMVGSSLQYAIQAAQKLVDYLTPEDILSVVAYDDYIDTIISPQTVEDPDEIKAKIGTINARGCTNLSGGWLMGCDYVHRNLSTERLNRVLLLTDGLANVGQCDPKILTNTTTEKAAQGIITTTLGFGTHFNEDLLINMANGGKGNFYFIQSPEDSLQVFNIEIESLVTVIAQNLTVMLSPSEGVTIAKLLNNYPSRSLDQGLEIFLGDVYQVENKPLALSLSIAAQEVPAVQDILQVSYKYETVIDDSIQQLRDQLSVSVKIGSEEETEQIEVDTKVLEQTNQFRIAQIKEEAIHLADQGDYQTASEKLHEMAEYLKQQALEIFEIAEEISQLEYYAQSLEKRRFDPAIRKELRDQSYQGMRRDRDDLKLRGITTGITESLDWIENPETGIFLKCERIGGKLRMRVISEGYDPNLNVQFPRSIREEGVTYVVDEVTLSTNGGFYRVSGQIRAVGKPRALVQSRSSAALKAVKSTLTLADLETTDTVGNGVLIQCVTEGKKLRARVVSDGYDPNYNVRFPRGIRQEGILFVVDAIKEGAGGSYIALGKVRRLVQ